MNLAKASLLIVASLLIIVHAGCSAPKSKGGTGATYHMTRKAVVDGEIEETIALFESQALEAEKKAAMSRQPSKYWKATTKAYGEACRLAYLSGQFQKAITYGEKAVDVAERTKDPWSQVHAISMLIDAHRYLRNFDKTTELLQKGFVLVKQLPSNSTARTNGEMMLSYRLGLELMRQREYEKAIDAFSQSVYFAQDLLDGRYRTGNHARIEDERTSLVLRLVNLGDAYREAGKPANALEHYQRALDHIKEWGLKYAYESELYSSIGDLYRRQKNYPDALKNLESALDLAKRQGRASTAASVHRSIGFVLLYNMGRPAEAIPHYEEAIRQIESIRSLLESQEHRRSFFEGGLGAYESIMRALLAVGREEESFNYSERARSRAFLDVLGTRVRLSKTRSGLLEEERALQEWIASIKAKLTGGGNGESDRAGMRKELAAAEKTYDDFLAKVRKENREQASLMSVEPLTLKQVQELLDPGTALIEYFVTDRELFIWVVEKEKLQVQRVELRQKRLASQVKSLRQSIFDLAEKERFKEISVTLYKELIEPLLPHITGKELMIVPHGVLHYLPFHALLSPDGKYLIESYPVYYLSSASLLKFTIEKRRTKGDKVLAFGNPDLGDPSMNLEFAELEAKEIQKLYPQARILLEKEATEEKAKQLSSNDDIAHFASHAELSEEDPLSSAILLAKGGNEDGRLEVREIFGMDLRANLVVLSACETGLGKLSSGDELVGLTRAFIYAGTPTVVASLWKVEDSSTAALMASFYKNLKTMSKVEALRQAQLELIRVDISSDLPARRGIGVVKAGDAPETKTIQPGSLTVSTSHPYFWAPFILVGDGK